MKNTADKQPKKMDYKLVMSIEIVLVDRRAKCKIPEVQVLKSEVVWTLTTICDFLGITENRTFHRWLKVLGIKPRYKKDGIYSVQYLENLATFYVATKILGMTQSLYVEKIVPRSKITLIPGLEGERTDHLFGLKSYFQQFYGADLYPILQRRIAPSKEIPLPVINVIRRLRLEYQ